jgi:hypothetical protein
LLDGLRRRSLTLLDLAFDLLVPPLSYVVLAVVLGTAVALTRFVLYAPAGHAAWWSAAPWCVAVTGLALYVGRGIWLANVGLRGVLDLMWAPLYIVWKVVLALRPSGSQKGEWVRTTREEGNKP